MTVAAASSAGADDLPVLGFVGLGGMGRRMAARLVARGHQVHGFDLSPEATADAAGSGVCVQPELRAVAEWAEVLLLSLPDSVVTEQVLFGAAGIADHLAPGVLVVDLTSGDPRFAERAAARLGERELRYVDVPVSGGFPGAEAGTLTLMAGGSDADVETARAVTAPLGVLRHVGGPGAGHLAKAFNNALYACALCISAEALVAARRWGLEPASLLDVWATSSGRNGAIDGRLRSHVLRRDFTGAMSAALMLKDVRHAIEAGRAVGQDMHWAETTAQHFAEFIDRAGGDAVDFGVVQLWEDAAGVVIE